MQIKNNSRKVVLLLVVLIPIVMVLFYMTFGGEVEKEYIFSDVSRGDVVKTISVTGSLSVLKPTIILSKVRGIVHKIHTDFNKRVSKGALLMTIDDSDISKKLLKISGSYEDVKVELDIVKRELEGKKVLYGDNLISKIAFEKAKMRYRTVLRKFKRIQLDYKLALEEKRAARIYSPIKGTVLSINKKEKEPVGVNTSLFMLTPSLSKMLLTIDIDESDIGNIKEGQPVVFSVSAYPDKRFNGVIRQVLINPKNKKGVVIYEAKVLCDNSEEFLKPGMTVTATVSIASRKKVLRVPNQAFIISPNSKSESMSARRNYLFIKESSLGKPKFAKKKVELGVSGDMYTEIVKGLKKGDEVLVKIEEMK